MRRAGHGAGCVDVPHVAPETLPAAVLCQDCQVRPRSSGNSGYAADPWRRLACTGPDSTRARLGRVCRVKSFSTGSCRHSSRVPVTTVSWPRWLWTHTPRPRQHACSPSTHTRAYTPWLSVILMSSTIGMRSRTRRTLAGPRGGQWVARALMTCGRSRAAMGDGNKEL